MFVLPRIVIPAARSRAVTVASYGRPPALEDLRSGGGRHVGRGEHVLERQRHPGQRRRRAACRRRARRRPARPTRARPRAATCRNACTAPSTAAIRSRCACATSTAETSRDVDLRGQLGGGHRDQVSSPLRPPPPGSAARGSGRPRRPGAPASACSWVRPGRRSSGRKTFCQRHGVRRRRDVVRGDLADAGDRAEDHVELAGEQVELRSVTASRASRARCATSSRLMPRPGSRRTCPSYGRCGHRNAAPVDSLGADADAHWHDLHTGRVAGVVDFTCGDASRCCCIRGACA